MNLIWADIITACILLSIFILTAIAAVRVKQIRDGRIEVIQNKQRLYRKIIYRYGEYRKTKAKHKSLQMRGKVKVPTIHA